MLKTKGTALKLVPRPLRTFSVEAQKTAFTAAVIGEI